MNPTAQQPGDKINENIDATNSALGQLIAFVATLFNTDGTLKPNAVAKAALTADLQDILTTLDTAAEVITSDQGLKWSEYIAGPVVSHNAAPAAIAATPFPEGLFADPIAGSPGGLFSAKYWALAAANTVQQVNAALAQINAALAALPRVNAPADITQSGLSTGGNPAVYLSDGKGNFLRRA